MKLQGQILITKSEREGKELQQLSNGFNYFRKFYQRLSNHYPGIEFTKFEQISEYIRKASVNFISDGISYDMSIWFVILKDLKFLHNVYFDCLGLSPTLYTEFLTMHISRIYEMLSDICAEVVTE